MESKRDLYCAGTNPNFYEAFDDTSTAQLIMALEDLHIPYTRIPYVDHGVKSLRLYVADKAESTSVAQRGKYIVSHHRDTEDLENSFDHYQLIYENSFV